MNMDFKETVTGSDVIENFLEKYKDFPINHPIATFFLGFGIGAFLVILATALTSLVLALF
jgi:hypothetical protein